ncbi:type IV pilus assembly protein PilM [Oceanithermus sp.]
MRNFLNRWLQPHIEALGLEIGAANLKLVEITGSPPTLRGYSIRPTPQGAIRGGNITEPSLIASEIREMLAEMQTRKRYVVAGVSNLAVITRIIQIPKMGERELEEAIHWEAERYIPFPIDEVVLDYAPLDPPSEVPDDAQLDVVIAAARLETITQLVETLKEAQLEPVVLDVKPFAGMRTIEGYLSGGDDGNDPVTIFLEIGAESSSLVLARGTRLLMHRNLNISGNDFTEAIAKSFGLDFASAEEVKRDYGLATIPTEDEESLLDFDAERERFNPARMYDAIRPVLVDATTELRRSLEFFRVQIGDINIDKGFITGGGSKLRGLPGILGEALGLQLNPVDPWDAVQINESQFDAPDLHKLAPEFAVPVGLGLRGVNPLD